MNPGTKSVWVSLLFFAATIPAAGQGSVKSNRDLMRMIAAGVADIIQKNFYDPTLKGLDWKKTLSEAQSKIAASNNVGEMYAAVDEMAQKMDDSHTNFMPPWQTQEPRFGLQVKPFGDTVRVYGIKENSPAARAGLQLGDTIIGIDGIPADRKHYFRTLYFYRLIEPAGTMVLDLVRDGKRDRITLKADIHTRFGIELVYDVSKTFDSIRERETYEKEHPFEYGKLDDIGYVKIADFRADAADKALWKVKDSRALVIDLRGNLGGETKELERFAGYFHQKDSEVVTMLSRDKPEKMIAKPRQPSFWDVPIVVLVDSESASASEIFARHMQLTGRAIVIGDKTMGAVSAAKDFVQHIGADPVVYYGVQTTVARVTFPDWQDLEKVGVTPDTMCVPSAYALAQKKDPCLDMAFRTLKEKLTPAPAEKK